MENLCIKIDTCTRIKSLQTRDWGDLVQLYIMAVRDTCANCDDPCPGKPVPEVQNLETQIVYYLLSVPLATGVQCRLAARHILAMLPVPGVDEDGLASPPHKYAYDHRFPGQIACHEAWIEATKAQRAYDQSELREDKHGRP